jgi:hypothetical protein
MTIWAYILLALMLDMMLSGELRASTACLHTVYIPLLLHDYQKRVAAQSFSFRKQVIGFMCLKSFSTDGTDDQAVIMVHIPFLYDLTLIVYNIKAKFRAF